jgi:anti-anti-sigma regulatory factor
MKGWALAKLDEGDSPRDAGQGPSMSLHVTTLQHSPDVVVLRIGGVGEERLLLALIDGITAIAKSVPCVVVDMDDLVLFSATAVKSFVGQLFDRVDHGCVVFTARRGTARQVLRRWGGKDVVIVDSVDDAGARCRAGIAG